MYSFLQKQNRLIAYCFLSHVNTVVTQAWRAD